MEKSTARRTAGAFLQGNIEVIQRRSCFVAIGSEDLDPCLFEVTALGLASSDNPCKGAVDSGPRVAISALTFATCADARCMTRLGLKLCRVSLAPAIEIYGICCEHINLLNSQASPSPA